MSLYLVAINNYMFPYAETVELDDHPRKEMSPFLIFIYSKRDAGRRVKHFDAQKKPVIERSRQASPS